MHVDVRAQEESAEPPAEKKKNNPVPFVQRPYRIKAVISFSPDARLSTQLRNDVLRRFRSHAAAFVGDAWQLVIQDVSGTHDIFSSQAIAVLTDDIVLPFTDGQDKVFVLGIRFDGDRFLLATREYDVLFKRWGPVFTGSARETTQIARELIVLNARMFSPLARLVAGDAKRVSVEIKGGRLPTLNPNATAPTAKYKPSVEFVRNGTLFRPMRPVLNAEGAIVDRKPMGWTFYEVQGRDGAFADCRIISALKNTLPPQSQDADDSELIVARSAGGFTRLRLVDTENKAPLPAMDIELRETIDGASNPLGTTDSDGRINVPPNRTSQSLVTVYVRHGRDTLAVLPILPGAGEEPDLELKPDMLRLDIEGRVTAVQEQIIDQVARRTILGGAKQASGEYKGGLIQKAMEKKDLKQAERLLNEFRASATRENMMDKLGNTRDYLTTLLDPTKWTPKMNRMFSETENIIDIYFNPDDFADQVESFEDDLKSAMDDAATAAAEGQPETPPAASGSAPPSTPSKTSS